MNNLAIALGLAALLTTASAFSEELQLPQQNDKLATTGQLALRASSPDSEFGTKGERIGWIKQGEVVKVLSLKQVSTVFGFEVWVQVQAGTETKGWIFDGMTEEVLKGRANLVKNELTAGITIARAN